MRLEEEEKEEKKDATVSPYAEKLLNTRTIFISGEINQELAKSVAAQLLILQETGNDPITVFINSQGGHVEAGDTIHDMLQFVRPEIYMVGTGWVASAGITIFLAAKKANRFSLPNTRYMIHQPAGGAQGTSMDVEIEAKEIVRIRRRIDTLISDATGQSYEKVHADTERNFWMNTEEAKAYGIIDSVITSINDLPAKHS